MVKKRLNYTKQDIQNIFILAQMFLSCSNANEIKQGFEGISKNNVYEIINDNQYAKSP